MASITECCSPCSTVLPTQIPGLPGEEGEPGTNGNNGISAFTITSADFEVPLVGANVTVTVGNSTWMTPGQNVFIQGAGYFTVVSKPTGTTVILTYADFVGNTNTGNTISAGAGVSPAGTQGPGQTLLPSISDYAVAGAQSLTNSSVQLLGISVTLPTTGSYLLQGTCRVDLDVATFNTSQDITLKLRETTNGPADVANAVVVVATGTPTLDSSTLSVAPIPPVVYSGTAGDTVQLFGTIGATPYSGAVTIVEASLLAIKLF